jgi:hypothetical protein
MLKARENKGSITCFARKHPEVEPIVLTREEWKLCKVIERVLKLFYNFTCFVSKDQPCLPETISIM